MTLRSSFGSLGNSRSLQLAVESLDVSRRGVDFGPCELAIVAGRVGEHLLRGLEVVGARAELTGARHDRFELLVSLGQLGVARLIAEDVRVGETRLDVGELRSPARRGAPTPVEGYKRQSPATVLTSAGVRSRAASARVTGMVVALGHHEHELATRDRARGGLPPLRERGRGRCPPSTRRRHRRPVAAAMSRSRKPRRGLGNGAARPDRARPEPGSSRIVHRSHRSGTSWLSGWRGAPGRRLSCTMLDHPSERGLGRQLAVDHRGQLAIGFADAHLEPSGRDARHFEPAQLTSEVTVLDHDVESRVDEERGQLRLVRRRVDRCRAASASRGVQLGALQPPHGGRVGEQRSPPGEQPGVPFDDEVQLVDRGAGGPRPASCRAPGPVSSSARPTRSIRRRGAAPPGKLACVLCSTPK